MTGTFSEARLKIERAVCHIEHLQEVRAAFLETDFYRLSVKEKPKAGEHLLHYDTIAEVWPEFALTIGDTIQNIRTALDYVTSEIVAAAGISDKRVSFPMDESREKLIRSGRTKVIKEAAPDIHRLIVDVINPYETNKSAIWALGKISNIDKHRLLIPVLRAVTLTGVCIEDDHHNVVQGLVVSVRGDGGLNLIGFPGKARITNYGKPTFDIFFGEGTHFDGEPVIPTLKQLAQLVFGVVQIIEAHYFGKGKPGPPGGKGDVHGV